MKTTAKTLLSALCLFVGFSAWAGAESGHYHAPDINRIAYAAADRLENNLLVRLNRTLPVLAASLVDIDSLESSVFGRLLGDRIGSRFSQHGYKIVELKLRKNTLHIGENGELALARDLEKISGSSDSQAVIVGTYALTSDAAYVSAKIVRTTDRAVISSWDFTVWLDARLKKMAGIDPEEETEFPAGQIENVEEALREGPLSSGLILLQPGVPLGARIIQNRLSELGFYTTKIDGRWGKTSKKALKSFKKDRKLPKNSKWDLATQKALFHNTGQ